MPLFSAFAENMRFFANGGQIWNGNNVVIYAAQYTEVFVNTVNLWAQPK